MPDGQEAIDWISSHAIVVIFWTVLLLLLLRFSGPVVHRVLVRVIRPPSVSAETGIDEEAEVTKRVATLEDLFSKIIRFAVVIGFLILLLSLFDAWSVLAGLGLLAAALTLAGQNIVLDYLTGILLLVEGPYFKGDVVLLDGHRGHRRGGRTAADRAPRRARDGPFDRERRDPDRLERDADLRDVDGRGQRDRTSATSSGRSPR